MLRNHSAPQFLPRKTEKIILSIFAKMQENLNKGLSIDLFETFEGKDKNKQKWGN